MDMYQKMATYAEQEAERRERLAEVGAMPPCPICLRPRVQRSDYVRCNPCGLNWLKGDDMDRSPRASRAQIPSTPISEPVTANSVPSAIDIFEVRR
jgi:hypothetical protein